MLLLGHDEEEEEEEGHDYEDDDDCNTPVLTPLHKMYMMYIV